MSEENKIESGSTFIRDLHQRTQKTHRNAIIVSVCLCVFVFGYMLWLTNMTKSYLKEEFIRTLVISWAEETFDSRAPELIAQGKAELPKYIQNELPKYITAQVPEIRQNVQTQADNYFSRNLEDVKPQVTAAIDEYVQKYQDDIKKYSEIIQAANNADADERKRLESLAAVKVRELADALIDNLLEIAKTREFGNESIDRTYKSSLTRLQRINTDLSVLADTPAKDLKTEDKDLRYAVALMLDKLEWSTPAHSKKPVKKPPTPAPKKKPAPAPKKK